MLQLKTFKGGYDGNFSYILHDDKEAVIIDISVKPEILMNFIDEKRLELKLAIIMHSHFDHLVGYDYYKENGIKLVASEYFKKDIEMKVKDGDDLMLGPVKLEVLYTPGHIYDAICILVEGKLFTSDTLFIDGCGRCDLEGADIRKMFESLQKIKELPDSTVIYPGHDYGNVAFASLEEQKKSNKYLRVSSLKEFIGERG